MAVILVGAAIAIGIFMFGTNNSTANRDAIIEDLNNLGSDAYSYCRKPTVMGGGSGSYVGYAISDKSGWGPGNANATYTVTSASGSRIQLTATSKIVEGASVSITLDNFHNIVAGPDASGF